MPLFFSGICLCSSKAYAIVLLRHIEGSYISVCVLCIYRATSGILYAIVLLRHIEGPFTVMCKYCILRNYCYVIAFLPIPNPGLNAHPLPEGILGSYSTVMCNYCIVRYYHITAIIVFCSIPKPVPNATI